MPLPNSDSFDTYGGSKSDFTTVVDPTTDRSAAEVNAAFASVASMTRTVTRAYLQFTGASTSFVVPNYHNSNWGSSLSVIPIIQRSTTGVFDITFPATVVDELGATQALNLTMGWGNIEGDTLAFIQVTKVTSNVFRVNLYDNTLAASDLVGYLIDVAVV